MSDDLSDLPDDTALMIRRALRIANFEASAIPEPDSQNGDVPEITWDEITEIVNCLKDCAALLLREGSKARALERLTKVAPMAEDQQRLSDFNNLRDALGKSGQK